MNKRQCCVLMVILAGIALLSRCMHPAQKDLRGPAYAGAATCARCHAAIYESYLKTAHYHTSAPADSTSVKGSFTPPENTFRQVVMENRNGRLFQNNTPFDITIGSATKAQTYLYWKDGRYYQLPVSYLTSAHSWANSPGFPSSHAKFDREVPGTCFGCHSSMVEVQVEGRGVGYTERFEYNKVIYGIDCERCHGPAAEHVAFHDAHPREEAAKFMTSIGSLKTRQQLDLCALCHSGLKTPQRSAFTFRPGDDLNDYFFPDITRPAKPAEMDVHGTQYQLFTASKCFIKSRETMTCSSCHDPHSRQTFVERCVGCHAVVKHSVKVSQDKCIDCHMPALPSSIKLLTSDGREVVDSIRTHLIGIYPAR